MAERTCSIPECVEPVRTRGFCQTHYRRWTRHGERMSRAPIRYPQTQLCAVEECLQPVEGRGYCVKHRQRAMRHGDTSATLVEWDPVKRFEAGYIVTESGCWEWQGGDKNQWGHGRFTVRGIRVGVHRWAYEHFVGPIPDGMVIDHVVCRNPPCVNPAHLEPVTQPVNVDRAPTAITTINSRKTHCNYGHPLAGPNLLMRHNHGRPCRQCRTCVNRRSREHQARKRALART